MPFLQPRCSDSESAVARFYEPLTGYEAPNHFFHERHSRAHRRLSGIMRRGRLAEHFNRRIDADDLSFR
jgi:hypothetical protein